MIRNRALGFLGLMSSVVLIPFFQNCGRPFQTQYGTSQNQSFGLAQPSQQSQAPILTWKSTFSSLSNDPNFSIGLSYQTSKGISVNSLTCQIDQMPIFDCLVGDLQLGKLADGDHTIKAKLIDSTQQTVELSSVIRIDKTAPLLELTEQPSAINGSNSAKFSFSAIDFLSPATEIIYQCSLDQGTYKSCTSPFQVSGLVSGNHNFKLRAIDKASNISLEKNVTWKIDNSAPNIIISQKPTAITNLKTASFVFSGSQNGQTLNQFQCSVDGKSTVACTSPYSLSNLSEGSHKLVLSVLSSTNTPSSPLTYSWIVDTVTPVKPNLVTMTPSITTTKEANFSFTSSDTGSSIAGYECALDTEVFKTCLSPQTLTNLSLGVHSMKVRALDTALNKSIESIFTWTIESLPIPIADGKILYANNCAACHGALATSLKIGRSEIQITTAIALIPQMSSIKLTTDEIAAIAKALFPIVPVGGITSEAAGSKYFPNPGNDNMPKRISRLTQNQIDLSVKSILPSYTSNSISSVMPADPLITNYLYSDILGINASNFAPLDSWITSLVSKVKANPKAVIDCSTQGNSVACLDTKARAFITKAFRGNVTSAKLKEFTDFYISSVTSVGINTATGDLVDLVLSSPQFLFREEFNVDVSSQLVAPQQLQLLTYLLADTPPESVSLASENSASLIQPSKKAMTVDLIINSTLGRAKLKDFLIAWLEIKDPKNILISTSVFPEYSPLMATSAVNEAKKFLDYHLSKPSPNLKELTQATQSFVDSNLASVYGVTAADPNGTVLTTLPSTQRLGIFSLSAVVVSHSGNEATRPLHRGNFFSKKVMCIPIGEIPPGADTTLPPATNMTERQRIEFATNKVSCLGCHSSLNPMGFFQENYNPYGKWRSKDNGLEIDSSISFASLDEGPLEANGPVDAIKSLTDSMMFKQCFIRQMFRFYVGRNEVASDDPLLKQMFLAFDTNGRQDILAALKVLMNSTQLMKR